MVLTLLVSESILSTVPVDTLVDDVVDGVDNRTRAVQLRAQGLTMAKIGEQLGISAQGVHKLLKTSAARSLPVARMEAASRTLAELAEATRQSAAEVFQMGIDRAKRRMREVGDGSDDAVAKTILETAKLSTDGARLVHGWGETNTGGGGRVAISLISDLRGLKSAQVVDLTPVAEEKLVGDDPSHHHQEPKPQQNDGNPP